MGVFAAKELRQLIERAERLKEEIKAIQEDLADVFNEAKSRGYDTAAMKEVMKLRAMDKDARDSRIALVSLYAEACGVDATPLERAIHKLKDTLDEAGATMEVRLAGAPN